MSATVSIGDNANTDVRHGAGQEPTIESRLEMLEKNVDAIHERISRVQVETREALGKILGAVQEEERKRSTEDRQIYEKLEASGTGDVHISIIGVVWLVVGVILTSAAPEMAGLVK